MGVNVKLDVYKTDGTKSGEQVELKTDIFGIEPNDHSIWLAVTAELANKRQGTASSKNRSEVRGGGKKPWRQKGRGTARAGSIRSPLWVGGGRAFGPTPRSYNKKLNKKENQLARKSALSYRAKENQIYLVEDFAFEAPKTKNLMTILNALNMADQKTLVLTSGDQKNVWLSGRNITKVNVREAGSFSTTDVMNAKTLLIQKSAVNKINEVLAK